MIDKVMAALPPEMRVTAEACEMTLDDDQKELLNTDLAELFDCLQAGNEIRAKEILTAWNAPEQCYELLRMALMVKGLEQSTQCPASLSRPTSDSR